MELQEQLSEYFQLRQFNIIWHNMKECKDVSMVTTHHDNKYCHPKTPEELFLEINPKETIYAVLHGHYILYAYRNLQLPKIIGLRGSMGHGKDTFALFLNQFAKNYQISRFSYGLRVAVSILTKIPIEKTWSDSEKMQLLKLSYPISEFAEVVKEMVLAVMQDKKERDWDLLANKCSDCLLGFIKDSQIHIELTLGKVLQLLGTEFFRNCVSEDCFVNYLHRNLISEYLIITDVRNVNEMKWVKENNGIIILINRPDATRKDGRDTNHFSETALRDIQPDVIIENDQGLLELEQKALRFLTN